MRRLVIFARAQIWSTRRFGVLGLVLALGAVVACWQSPVQPLPTVRRSGPDEFRIGMWGFGFNTTPFTCGTPGGPLQVVTNSTDGSGNPTSQLNVLKEDGFNIVADYQPGLWQDSECFYSSYLQLIKNHGLKTMVLSEAWYRPVLPCNNSTVGSNVYDNSYDNSPNRATLWWGCKVRPHWQNMIDYVGSTPNYKDVVWGWHMAGESNFYHWFNASSDVVGNDGPHDGKNCNVEVPPQNVDEAIGFFRNRLNAKGVPPGYQKIIVAVVNHGKSINNYLMYDGEGQYLPQQYINLSNKPDAIFEASYYQFPIDSAWKTQPYSNINNSGQNDNNYHYLAKFKNIDFIKGYNSNVHAEMSTELNDDHPSYYTAWHSDLKIRNANYLWFQTYTSIIHGVSGVWFWGLPWSWDNTSTDHANASYVANPNTDRFNITYFPEYYKRYVRHLARELRYLVNNNFLDTDPASVLYAKRDHPDDLCMVGPPETYIPLTDSDHRSEHYGLRYTIRTNGQDAIMIVTNPLPIVVTPTFDFQQIANGIIANSTGVEVLFEQGLETPTLPSYKMNRDGRVDLATNSAVTRTITYSAGTMKFCDVFGPLDVHVYKFVKGSAAFAKPLWYHKALDWDAPPIADGSLVVDSDATHVFYRGIDNRIYNFWRDGSRWRNDALDYSAPAIAAGNLVLNASGDHLFFIGTDKRIYNFWWTGAKWQLDWLGPAQIAAENLVVNPAGDHVFFTSTDNRVCNYWWNLSKKEWQLDELDPAQIAAGNLVVNGSGDHVFFIGTNKRVYNYWWNPSKPDVNEWQLDWLTPCAPPLGIRDLVIDRFGRLFDVENDGRVYTFYWSSG